MKHLCEMLGQAIGRPFVDETRLEGSFDVEVRHDGETLEGLFRALRDQASLIATPDRRDLTMLLVRPR